MKTIPFDIEKAKDGAKVVTRKGDYVIIRLYDWNDDEYPILGYVNNKQTLFTPRCWRKDGLYSSIDGPLDLFLVSEEKEELTEFEYNVASIIETNLCQLAPDGSMNFGVSIDNTKAKKIAQEILELARKELQPNIDNELNNAYKDGFKAGMDMWRPTLYQTVASVPCEAQNGICTNPEMDCISCHKKFAFKNNITTSTFTDGKEHPNSFIE